MCPPVSPITGLIRLGADLAFLAIAGHADRVLDAQRHEVLRGLLGTFFTQHQVVFPAPAFVAEAFDEEFRVDSLQLISHIHLGIYTGLISAVTLEELEGAPENVRSIIRDFGDEELVRLEQTETVLTLAHEYLKAKVVPVRYEDDALHVA